MSELTTFNSHKMTKCKEGQLQSTRKYAILMLLTSSQKEKLANFIAHLSMVKKLSKINLIHAVINF